MDFDVEGSLSAVERSVSSPQRGGQPARAVTLSRIYPTTVEDLWDAVTNGQRIPRCSCRSAANSSLVAGISWKATQAV